jgi:hypothetical protein
VALQWRLHAASWSMLQAAVQQLKQVQGCDASSLSWHLADITAHLLDYQCSQAPDASGSSFLQGTLQDIPGLQALLVSQVRASQDGGSCSTLQVADAEKPAALLARLRLLEQLGRG